MSHGRLLDQGILEAFDRALTEYAPAVRARLVHPGLEEEEVTAKFASVGIHPSEEGLAWWGYFDERPPEAEPLPCDVLPDFQFLRVDDSLGSYRRERGFAEENAKQHQPPLDPEEAWGSQWVPIFFMGSGGNVVLDCEGPQGAPSPLRSVRPDTVFAPDHALAFADSLGDLLIGATKWMERGTCRYQPEHGMWWPFEAWADQSAAERYGLSAPD
jgi:hypothetical protein